MLSGIQPTGALHLGNYLGAIRRWVDDQDRVDGYFTIVDLHAMTIPHDPDQLRGETLTLAAMLFAVGLDPERSTVFVQSHVREHAELAWIMNCVTAFGELNRMTQWKDKSEGQEFVSAGLFTYPALQAADILLYDTDEVPVGEDQRQHVELTRDVAQRFNHRFGEVFVLPKATFPKSGARVMDLQLVDKKMSKSLDSPRGTIYLLDDPKDVEKKVMSAVTDSGTDVRHAPDEPEKTGVTNLLDLLSAASGEGIPSLEARFADRGYGDFKKEVASAVVELLRPLREAYAELASDPGEVKSRLAVGADKARETAARTLARAKDAAGLLPPRGDSWA
ncbi:MAG: tryptophan--tRNA ligase [Nitriliruptorales bacterium]